MTQSKEAEDGDGRAPFSPWDTIGSPPPAQSRQPLPHRPSRRIRPAVRLALWAGAALVFYLLTDFLAATLGSWLIGSVGAGILVLLALALLSSGASSTTDRRR